MKLKLAFAPNSHTSPGWSWACGIQVLRSKHIPPHMGPPEALNSWGVQTLILLYILLRSLRAMNFVCVCVMYHISRSCAHLLSIEREKDPTTWNKEYSLYPACEKYCLGLEVGGHKASSPWSCSTVWPYRCSQRCHLALWFLTTPGDAAPSFSKAWG